MVMDKSIEKKLLWHMDKQVKYLFLNLIKIPKSVPKIAKLV